MPPLCPGVGQGPLNRQIQGLQPPGRSRQGLLKCRAEQGRALWLLPGFLPQPSETSSLTMSLLGLEWVVPCPLSTRFAIPSPAQWGDESHSILITEEFSLYGHPGQSPLVRRPK